MRLRTAQQLVRQTSLREQKPLVLMQSMTLFTRWQEMRQDMVRHLLVS